MSLDAIFKKTVAMTAATAISQIVGVFTSVAMRGFLGPAAMGVWSILQVVLGYCGYASFGTTKALARDYPILRGRGDYARAEALKNLTLTFSMVMSVLPAIALGGYTLFAWNRLEPVLRNGFLFLCGFLFIQRFYDLVLNLLRSDKKFETVSVVTVLNAVGMLMAVFLFVRPFKIYGLFAGSAIVTVFLLIFIIKFEKYDFRWHWSSQDFFQQLKLGIPLLLLSFLTTFFLSLDKLLTAKFLGFKEVGYYSIAMMIGSLVTSFPMMLSNVLYPHTLEHYGRDPDKANLAKHLHAPAYSMALAVPLLCGGAFYLMPLVLRVFLKEFIGGLDPMRVYLLGLYFVMLARFSTNVLTALDKYWISILILGITIGVHFLLSVIFIKMGYALMGIAWATSLSCFVYGVSSYAIAVVYVEGFSLFILRSVLGPLLFFAVLFILILAIDMGIPSDGYRIVPIILKLFLMGVLAVPFALVIEKKYPFFSRIYNSFKQIKK